MTQQLLSHSGRKMLAGGLLALSLGVAGGLDGNSTMKEIENNKKPSDSSVIRYTIDTGLFMGGSIFGLLFTAASLSEIYARVRGKPYILE